MIEGDLAHSVSVKVDASPEDAFDFMIDPDALGRWALGCMDLQRDGLDGVYTGTSIFDGSRSWLHIEADRIQHVVHYHLGNAEVRKPRIQARVSQVGDEVTVTLLAQRGADMDDARWERLRRSHELEILIIQAHCPQWVSRSRP
ncbi:SRPBCC family protein [Devosia sp. 2618]|uniref:SRPBCC family protein n=1 Tax=Devosia sp. 2618 TaxID=3156454 RepID=UPI003392662D